MNSSGRFTCLVGLVGALAWLALPSSAVAGPPADFNGDGKADLAIGVPGEQVGGVAYAGAATVLYGSDERLTATYSQMFRLQDFGIAAAAGDLFGASLAWADFNGDTMTDLVIGAPGARRVVVMFGASGRLSAERFLTVSAVSSCGWFGGALATGNFDGDAYPDLAVGAPHCIATTGGTVFAYSGGEDGIEHLQKPLTLSDFSTSRKARDDFGAALAAGDFNGDGLDDLAVGIPGRDHTSIVVDAGAVAIYHGARPSPDLATSFLVPRRVMNQENGGDHVNETSDHFGAVLAAADFNGDGYHDLAVGVPQEDVSGLVNAGEVTIYIGRSSGLLPYIGHAHFHQDSQTDWASLAGVAEPGDRLGASLAAADFDGDGIVDLAIGVPGEDAGGAANAGVVHVLRGLYLSGLTLTGNKLFHQNTNGVLDACEANDFFGSSLTAGDYDGNGYADLAVGVSGEDWWAAEDTGAMQVLYSDSTGVASSYNQFWTQASAGVPDHPEPWDAFGAGLYGHIR